MSIHDIGSAQAGLDPSIAIGGSFTIDPIQHTLNTILERASPGLSVEIAPYGQLFQSLLDPGSLMRCKPRILNVMLLRLSDLANSSEASSSAETALSEFLQATKTYSQSSKTPLLIILTPEPRENYQQRRAVNDFGDIDNVYVANEADIAALYPVGKVHDHESNRIGHIPYTDAYYAALAIYIARFAWRTTKPEKKVLVLDCDNTLWKGVCGELGAKGVEISAELKAFQRHIVDLTDQGMLICLNSKNLEQDVMAVFEQNANMVLRKEHLTTWRINWNSKSQNIQALAAELNLSTDSFVFIDDNPMEIAEVQNAYPEVLCVELPKRESEYKSRLQHCWALDKHRVTDADKSRSRSYQQNLLRHSLEKNCDDFKEFLAKLQLEVSICPLQAEHCERVAQISQRTNQFNTTTRRRDVSDVRSMLSNSDPTCYTVQVKDRFGDYGLVGVVGFNRTDKAFLVDSFMLSCRVLGKGVEHAVLRHVAGIAKRSNFDSLIVEYHETSRNVPAKNFLQSIGHARHEKGFSYDISSLCELEYSGQMGPQQPAVSSRTIEADSTQHAVLEFGWYCRDVERVLRALRRFEERPAIADSYVAPKPGLEQSLAHIWGECLRIKSIGRNDRFNELGGNSLDLVRIHSAIKNTLGRDVDLTVLLRMPTIALLSQHLEQEGTDGSMVSARIRAQRQRAAMKRPGARIPRKQYE